MNSSNPVVSVLMTSYNREKYIAEAIESVLASTFTDFELVIVDDCSKDRTVEIARSYAAKDNRVKVFINENNLGDYVNRNKAASHATGTYLKYVDADDMIYPWGLEILVLCMDKFPEVGWGLCSLQQDVSKIFPFVLSPAEAFMYHYAGPGLFHKAPLSSIIRKDLFDSIGGFSGKRQLGDFEMWHMLAKKNPVLLMPHGIVWYRVHDSQESNENQMDPRVPFRYFVSAYNYFKFSTDLPINDGQRELIIKKLSRRMDKLILVKTLKWKFRLAYDLLRMKNSKEHILGETYK